MRAPAGGGSEGGGSPDGLPPLRDVIERCRLAPRKALGQNFLCDLNLTRRIARAAGPLETVVEIGPGPGGLTRALLLEGAAHVIAIERDARCLPALEEIAERWPGRLSIIEGDALHEDPAARLNGRDAKIVANLPYNIGTELLVRWLRGQGGGGAWPSWWRSATVMLQREVADRVVAEPGGRAYGRLSVLTSWRATARIAFEVGPQAFTPPPKVRSAVLSIQPRVEPPAPCRLEALERVAAAAFSQRRKMLRSALKGLSHELGLEPEVWLSAAGVVPTARAETIDIHGFAALARFAEDRL